jgi:glycosyltransferase involved in cell wall biosynthesis
VLQGGALLRNGNGSTAPANNSTRSICFVTEDLHGEFHPNTPFRRTTRSLAAASWQVHVLYIGPENDDPALARVGQDLARAGIGLTTLGDLPPAKRLRVFQPTPDSSGNVTLSNLVRLGLETLHSRHRFDLVEIPSARGVGLRTIQAKQVGLAFEDCTLIVRLTGPGTWQREARKLWDAPNDLVLDYCERTTFENADVQLSQGQDSLAAARDLGWHVSTGARMVPEMTAELYAEILDASRRSSRRPADPLPRRQRALGDPLVTVAVSHYNLGNYLPESLASLASQTFTDLEVLVVDDGSTCPKSRRVLEQQQRLYPRFRFICQANAGPGAARNRALAEARGELFIPVDADNIAMPDMVERFVRGMRHCSQLAGLTCFFLVFREAQDIANDDFLSMFCPTGGPHLLACVHNVYGDMNAIFRTADLRAAGGFEADRNTCLEDWETFVKLVNGGFRLGVIPQPLFYYRHRTDGRSMAMTRQWTDDYPFVQRILKRFYVPLKGLPAAEARSLWSALASYVASNDRAQDHRAQAQAEVEHLQQLLGNHPLRYRIADRLNRWLKRVPLLQDLCKRGLLVVGDLTRRLRGDRLRGSHRAPRQVPPAGPNQAAKSFAAPANVRTP